ncbi:MAG TPA: protein phosphatase 2C domain-containing protein [Ktedonobacterales bacterium]|nr:protein phosphatase 2C domain-containing protein [Ktedonobacterales bacterium]
MAQSAAESRPPEGAAYARIAVVRVLTYYDGTASGDAAPIPVLTPCAADGTLVGTTGANLNSFDYVLTPTAAVNPINPCQGVQAAFAQLYGNATGWSIGRIQVLLDVAYTGTGAKQMGTVAYSIDPSQIVTNGGAGSASLLALALATPQGTHDLPVLSVPQPSDAPATGNDTVLDLTNFDGQPLGRSSLNGDEVSTTLYPIAVPASQLNAAPQPSPTKPPTATPLQQTVTGGTAVPPTSTPLVPTVAQSTPTPLSAQVGLGAPEIDSNGRLIGMVIADARGNHVLASLQDVTAAIGAVTGRSGPLMSQWQQGIAAYYANPPQYAQAASAFDGVARGYSDFGGVAPFQSAAHQQSPAIPSLTKVTGATTPNAPSGGLKAEVILIAAAIGVVALLLIALVLVLLLRRRRRQPSLASLPAIPPDEAMLDLLPPNASLDMLDTLELSVPLAIDGQPTQPLPAVTAAAIEQQATLRIPAVRPDPARTRKGLALMPHSAGMTDAGIRRASEPNQDNVLAIEGIRIVDGRAQPWGLFIVADGMGGHLNGQDASRIAIEIVTTTVLQVMTTSQPLNDEAIHSLLRDGVQKASVELRQRNLAGRQDMGTTLTGALVVDDMAYVMNVGDSRTYLMSPETGLRQITTDHSVVASLVAAGVIRPDEIYTHPRRNQIYRSLGGEQDEVELDTFEVPLQAGDKLLFCSDGLWEMVRDPQIQSILRGTADPRQAAELLVREANANGGEDNIGAVVVRLLEDVPQNPQAGMRVLAMPHADEPQKPPESPESPDSQASQASDSSQMLPASAGGDGQNADS